MADSSCWTIDAIFLSVILSFNCLTLLSKSYLGCKGCHARRITILDRCGFDLRSSHIIRIYARILVGCALRSLASTVLSALPSSPYS